MKTRLLTATTLTFALLACLIPSSISAKGKAARMANQSATVSGTDHAGSFGVMVADLSAPNGPLPGLGASYWITDKFAIDAALAGMSGSSASGGTDAAGRPVNDSSSSVAFAVAGRFTVARPVDALHIQALVRATAANEGTTRSVLGVSNSTNKFGLGALLGVGFEAFIPGLDSLSVQADSGLYVNWISPSTTAAGPTPNAETNMGIGQAGRWLPMNVSIHYYF